MKDKVYEAFLDRIQEYLAANQCWVEGYEGQECIKPAISQSTLDRISMIQVGTVKTMDRRPCAGCTRAAEKQVGTKISQGEMSAVLFSRDAARTNKKRRNLPG